MTGSCRGLLIVFVSPSGGGKTTLLNLLKEKDPKLGRSISVTTRLPREGEKDAEHYYFKSNEEFARLVREDAFIEHATVFGNSYGVLKSTVEEALSNGQDLGFVLDWQGFQSLSKAMPEDVVGIYLLPPSLQELERRLRARGDQEEILQERMQQVHSELSHSHECNIQIVNNTIDQTLKEVENFLTEVRINRAQPLSIRNNICYG